MMDTLCRVCFKTDASTLIPLSCPVVSQSIKDASISEILTSTTGATFDENSRAPQFICDKCLTTVNDIYKIRNRFSTFQLLPRCKPGKEKKYLRCRACAGTKVDELVSLSCTLENDILVSELIQSLTKFEIEKDDGLPPYVCDLCLRDFSIWYNFKKDFLQSEDTVQQKALFAWEKMQFQEKAPKQLVVEMYAEANEMQGSANKLVCNVCKFQFSYDQINDECKGCLLPFQNYTSIIELNRFKELAKAKGVAVTSKDTTKDSSVGQKNIQADNETRGCGDVDIVDDLIEKMETDYLENDLHADALISQDEESMLVCSVCNLEFPILQLTEMCAGCLLPFRNVEAADEGEQNQYRIKARPVSADVISERESDVVQHSDLDDCGETTAQDEEEDPIEASTEEAPEGQQTSNESIAHLFDKIKEDGIYDVVRRKGPYCCKCSQFFLSDEELNNHKEQVEHPTPPDDQPYACNICNTGFSSSDALATHTKAWKEDTFRYCKVCDILLLTQLAIVYHTVGKHVTHREIESVRDKYEIVYQNLFDCCVHGCWSRLVSIESVQLHRKRYHSNIPPSSDDNCQYCKKRLFGGSDLEGHLVLKKDIQKYQCKIGDCQFKTVRQYEIIWHCLLYQRGNGQCVRPKPAHPRAVKPDMKHFEVVGSLDERTDKLESTSVICCSCFTFHETVEELEEHVMENHAEITDNLPYRCTKCNKGFKYKNSLETHQSWGNLQTFYFCRPCDIFFWRLPQWQYHSAYTHANDDDKTSNERYKLVQECPMACCGCDQEFDEEEELIEHRRQEHPPGSSTTTAIGKDVECRLCHKRFKDRRRLADHARQYATKGVYKCLMQGCTFSTPCEDQIRDHVTLSVHTRRYGRKVYTQVSDTQDYGCCIVKCIYRNVSYEAVVEHAKKCHKEKRAEHEYEYERCDYREFKCACCRKGFTDKASMYRHQFLMHYKNCKFCGKSMKASILVAHEEGCEGKRPVTCEECGKVCPSVGHFKKHRYREHLRVNKTVEKKLMCNICGKTKTAKYMRIHMQVHEDVRPWKCELCPKAFHQKVVYLNHQRVHTGEKKFACRQGCDKRYKAPGDRDRHERDVHLGLKPFKCAVCNEGFIRERDLRLHCRKHTGRKLYDCINCSEEFNKLSEFTEHQQVCVSIQER